MKINKLMLVLVLLGFMLSLGVYGCNDDNDVTDGDVVDGDVVDGDAVDGDAVDGDAVDGDAVDGDAVDGDAVDGDAVDGDVVDGDAVEEEQEVDGDATDGDAVEEEQEVDGDVVEEEQEVDGDATDGDATDGEQASLASNEVFSECGGFGTTKEEGLCRDENFVWSYNDTSQTLTVVNQNVWLNCCGEHSLAVELASANSYDFTETDEPDGQGGRCSCMCFFDYGFDLEDVSGTINFSITRVVTDGATSEVWEGSIDLSEDSGSITIETDLGYCN